MKYRLKASSSPAGAVDVPVGTLDTLTAAADLTDRLLRSKVTHEVKVRIISDEDSLKEQSEDPNDPNGMHREMLLALMEHREREASET